MSAMGHTRTELAPLLVHWVLVVPICGVILFLTPLVVTWAIIRNILGRFVGFPQQDKRPETLDNPRWGQHSYTKLKDVKLHYVEKGNRDRPLLLLLHGFPEFWYSWRHQILDLSDKYWVVAVDLRGFGDSEKPSGAGKYRLDIVLDDIHHLILHLGRDQCILAGHDWGGVLAWSMAIRHPEMVQQLIVLNYPHPSAFVTFIKRSVWQTLMSFYMTFFQIPLAPELFLWGIRDILFHALFWLTGQGWSRISSEDIEVYRYMYSSPGAFTGPINYYRAGGLYDSISDPQVKVRTLIIWGMKDIHLSSAMAYNSTEYVQHWCLRPVHGASHWVHQDHPQEVNTYIRDFLHRN